MNNARQVYTAAVRPAVTHGAAIWHTPKETRSKGLGPAAKVMTIQNKCLRAAYKATNIKVLEAEAVVMPRDMFLGQTVLKSRTAPGCPEMIDQAKEVIKKKLGNKRRKHPIGNKRYVGQGPLSQRERQQRKRWKQYLDNSSPYPIERQHSLKRKKLPPRSPPKQRAL